MAMELAPAALPLKPHHTHATSHFNTCTAHRNVKPGKGAADMSSIMRYLARVKDVMKEFEARLWEALDDYVELSQSNPTLLVDCCRVIELQVGSSSRLYGHFVCGCALWMGQCFVVAWSWESGY